MNLTKCWATTALQAYPPMSEEQLKDFIAKAKEDQSIQHKLQAAKTPDEVVDIAKESGHDLNTEKLYQLSDQDLEGISGGQFTNLEFRGWCTQINNQA